MFNMKRDYMPTHPIFKKGEAVFWRWKGDKRGYTFNVIEDVNGSMITFNPYYSYSRTWIDVNDIDVKRVEPNTDTNEQGGE